MNDLGSAANLAMAGRDGGRGVVDDDGHDRTLRGEDPFDLLKRDCSEVDPFLRCHRAGQKVLVTILLPTLTPWAVDAVGG